MNGDWSEGASLTWNTVGGVSQAGSTLLGILSPRAKGSYTAFLNEAGLAQVRAWVDGSVDNQGFAIYDHSTNDGLNFRSSNYGTVAQRPKLTLIHRNRVLRSAGAVPPPKRTQGACRPRAPTLGSSCVRGLPPKGCRARRILIDCARPSPPDNSSWIDAAP